MLVNQDDPDKKFLDLQELEADRAGLLAKQRELQLQHDQMVSDRRSKQAQVAELQQRIVEVQQFKFGQVRNPRSPALDL